MLVYYGLREEKQFMDDIKVVPLPTPEEARAFFKRLRAEYPGWSLADIRAYYEANEDAAGLMSLDLAIKALHPRNIASTPDLDPADFVENVPQNLPKGVLNRAHYNNTLTLYALITLVSCHRRTKRNLWTKSPKDKERKR